MLRKLLKYLVGGVFLLSGLVKAIDPVGFSFKLEEYFSPAVLNLPFLEAWALPLAIFVSGLEVVLGLFLISGRREKLTLNLLIGLCIFFGFLTFYSAYYNKVTDCGCFGEALKLTPWMSFAKDIVLLLLLVWLRMSAKGNAPTGRSGVLLEISGIILLAFVVIWGLVREPLVDFRDYNIGTDLANERRKSAARPPKFELTYHLRNQKTGQELAVAQSEYLLRTELWQPGTPWTIQSEKTETKMVDPGYETEIRKLLITNAQGRDLTDSLLAAPRAVLLISYRPENLSVVERHRASSEIKKLGAALAVSPKPGLFPGVRNATADATVLKTIVRSNPAVVVLAQGKLVRKGPL